MYRENIIERPIPIEVICEQVIEKPVEHIVERPVYVENLIQKYVDNIIENPVAIEQRIDIPVAQYIDTHFKIDHITPVQQNYVLEKPVRKEFTVKRPVEYIITKTNPVAQDCLIEINVPSKTNIMVQETIIDKPVTIERIIERPRAVQQIVEVDVVNERERPVYVENIIHKKVMYDQEIEEKYEVLVPNEVIIEVHKEILVPQKTTTRRPVEVVTRYERDVNVDTLVTVPTEGHEFLEADTEVTDEDLNRRIHAKKNLIQQRLNEVAQRNRLVSDLNGKISDSSSTKYNSLLTNNARLSSERMELESRLDIVQKDRERLAIEKRNRTTQHISYTAIPTAEVNHLKKELESLLSQNNALISQVKNAANQVNNATVL